MLSKKNLAYVAIVFAFVIAASEYLGLPSMLHYLWALIVLVWGILALKAK